jgi:acyl carrier protein|tara:strand:- start:636 stop:872 length:237 start_codon:yes stop_codon:yes gene_type:complete
MIEIKKKIRKIILETLRLKNKKIKLDADSIDNWDSIGHLHIISALEKDFSVSLSSKQVSNMLSDKSIYEVISKIKKTK